MAFQIKSFASIAASMLNFVRSTTSKITDLSVGSIVRTLLEAPAIEIDELYQQMFNGLKEAIPVSMYTTLSFDALPAVASSGNVRVTISASATATTIPAGTVFADPSVPVKFASVLDVTIAAGQSYVDVRVVAQSAGAASNIDAGKTFSLTPSPSNFVSASNLSPFKNGDDAESPAAQKARFKAYIQTLSRGTTAAIEYGLSTVELYDANGSFLERVATASVVEPWLTDSTQPISLVNCYVHNGVGGTSGDLLARARQVIYGYVDANGVKVPGWKAAGVNVQIYAATEVPVAVTGVLTTLPGYAHADVVTLALQAVSTYISSLGIGQTAIEAEIVALIMALPGVSNIVLSSPLADVPATASQKLMPGAISFT